MKPGSRRRTHSKPVVRRLELKAEKKISLANGDVGLKLDD